MRKRVLMLGVLVVVVALLVAAAAAIIGNRAPILAPPGAVARLAIYLTDNVAQVSPSSRYPELRSPRYRLPASDILAEVAAAATALGFVEVAVDDTRRRVSAVAVSSLFGFRDDIEVVVHDEDGVGTLLARSASRVGRADFGANQYHLRRLLQELQARLAASAVPP